MTLNEIRTWLLAYAWLGDAERQAAEVECIMSQEDVQHLAARAEQARGRAFDDTQASTANTFALSALYECHDGPHLSTCPYAKEPA